MKKICNSFLRFLMPLLLSLALLAGCTAVPNEQTGDNAEAPFQVAANLKDYVIVYPATGVNEEKALAETLATAIETTCGFSLPVQPDAEAKQNKKMICIGLTVHNSFDVAEKLLEPGFQFDKHAYHWTEKEGKVSLIGESAAGYLAGIDAMCASLESSGAEAFDVSTPLEGVDTEHRLRIMSYNIYYKDPTTERMGRLVEMIRKYDPDIIGLQEIQDGIKEYFISALEDYEFLGRSRSEKYGEYSPIMYKKDKFTLIESGTRWLSDTPAVPDSKYEESSVPRIFTYAVLERNSDGARFVHINTHIDLTQESRVLQLASLEKQIAELGLDQYSIILTGDMNSQPTDEENRIIKDIGFDNSRDIALEVEGELTYYPKMRTIDYCFVSKDDFEVLNHTADSYRFNESLYDPSDHGPVIADLLFKEN